MNESEDKINHNQKNTKQSQAQMSYLRNSLRHQRNKLNFISQPKKYQACEYMKLLWVQWTDGFMWNINDRTDWKML